MAAIDADTRTRTSRRRGIASRAVESAPAEDSRSPGEVSADALRISLLALLPVCHLGSDFAVRDRGAWTARVAGEFTVRRHAENGGLRVLSLLRPALARTGLRGRDCLTPNTVASGSGALEGVGAGKGATPVPRPVKTVSSASYPSKPDGAIGG